jgi:hypothetical protein
MSIKLDREGIFMARAIGWQVRTFDSSQAVAVNIEFQILGQLNDAGGWDDWREYEEHTVYGMFFVLKKDGTVNTTTIEQLARSLGWNGDLYTIGDDSPPRVPVQITVKAEEYKSSLIYKASWINPKDFKPQPIGASNQQVADLNARFGSLLRAAAAAALSPKTEKPVSPGSLLQPTQRESLPLEDDSDLPF